MKQKMINSQLNNYQSYLMYRNQLCSLAKNVFLYEGMPEIIDMAVIKNRVLKTGSVAFFNDEFLGVLALPYNIIGKLDIYGNPVKIEVFSTANAYRRVLNSGEFVIMYDNLDKISLMPIIIQYAERLALCDRTIDINISQQKTPRVWKVPQSQEKTFKDMVNNVDSYIEQILTYNDLGIESVESVLSPAPFVTDKIQTQKEKLYNEFLRVIGVSSVNIQKKERLITDEIQASQGGSIVMRYNRYEPRLKAVNKINEKWGTDIQLKYYDNVPASFDAFKEKEENFEESEVLNYASSEDEI